MVYKRCGNITIRINTDFLSHCVWCFWCTVFFCVCLFFPQVLVSIFLLGGILYAVRHKKNHNKSRRMVLGECLPW